MRSLSSLNNKRIAVVGLGLTGQSCVRFLLGLQQQWNIEISAMDTCAEVQVDFPINITLGKWDTEMLQQADILVVSPGISLQTSEVAAAAEQGKLVIGDIELFAWYYNAKVGLDSGKKLIAVTGSNGKSTVVTLIKDIVMAADYKAALGGNIGTPALDLFDEEADVYILELSSFQLESTSSLIPDVACILNLCEDHMDRYEGLQAYCAAKQRIYMNAKHAICNADDSNTFPQIRIPVTTFDVQFQTKGFSLSLDKRNIQFDGVDFVSAERMQVVGIHNLLNVQAAAAMAMLIGIDKQAIVRASEHFIGLPHRCQRVSDKHGVLWINDSKATNVGATLAAISGLRPAISGQLILLAGGDSKQADLHLLKNCFEHDVDRLYVFGKDATLLSQLSADAEVVADLDAAVKKAAEVASEGDAVLLSPACASLDMFRNYTHRGQCFVEAVEALT